MTLDTGADWMLIPDSGREIRNLGAQSGTSEHTIHTVLCLRI
jgi:hypothetical protein